MPSINFGDMLLWYVAFLFSFTAHEAAHAYIAMKGGDLTAYLGGQVSLNPLPHIQRSPFGTVIIPVISYFFWGWMIGWASAPYDPNWAIRYPKRAAIMAAAGPAANLAIALIVFIIMKAGLTIGALSEPGSDVSLARVVIASEGIWVTVAKLLSILFMLNLILFIFNLFPLPPLDGSSVITLFMSPGILYRYRSFISQPAFAFLGLILAWRIFPSVFRKVFFLVFNLLHG